MISINNIKCTIQNQGLNLFNIYLTLFIYLRYVLKSQYVSCKYFIKKCQKTYKSKVFFVIIMPVCKIKDLLIQF